MSDLSELPLAVTMGEPAGLGPDLILRLFARREELGLSPFVVFGHADFLRARAQRLGLFIRIEESTPVSAARVFPTALPVVPIDGLVPDKPGDPTPLSGKVVIESISRAVGATLTGLCRGVVTAPIHKGVLYTAGFKYPGHTEYLAALCAGRGVTPLPVMMLAHDDLRVVPATIHVPMREVPGLLNHDMLVQIGRVVSRGLRSRFGIAEPRLAMAGLNPHAGEGGAIGYEDLEIIAPAVATLQREGVLIDGPLPADTLFYPRHWRHYDAVIAMYHDQALIPIKAIAFEAAVNVTLGLPIVRTSPDHGTAFDLAGSGDGSDQSMLAAIRLAEKMTGDDDLQAPAQRATA